MKERCLKRGVPKKLEKVYGLSFFLAKGGTNKLDAARCNFRLEFDEDDVVRKAR